MNSAGLLRLNSSFDLEPDWAISWEPLGEREGWRFRLQVNASGWEDGVPVTAHDYAAHWMSLLDPGSERSVGEVSPLLDVENALAYHLGEADADAVGINPVDDWTLVVYLERSRETFPKAMAALALRPNAPEAIDSADVCAGNGRFQVTTRGEELLSMEPASSYWDRERPDFDRIDLSTASPGLSLTQFRQSNMDLIRLSSNDIDRVRDDALLNSALTEALPNRIIMLIPNVEIAPFNRIEVRRVLSMVIDRQRLEHIVAGRVTPAMRLFPSGMFPELDDAAAGTTADFDVDQAYAELDEAVFSDPLNWPGFGLDIPAGDSYLDRVARDVASQFRENLGIQVPIRVHEPEEYAAGLRERRFALAWYDWTYPYADPASGYLELFASWRDPVRPVSWSDPEYDELLLAAETLVSDESRASAWAGCEGLLQERGAVIPLVHPVDFYLVQPWLEELPRDGRGRLITAEAFGFDLTREARVEERSGQ